uniref:Uncharacterized protein n=1 Tax=Oryza sativa subsp. japonica TaxID=39947 RepID=Q84YU7_ORYSJ|nr:formin-like protein 2 [Oryza sativa Japonica Group]BAC57797.1 hypothetical protein [Oryza sativa Japonica Group]
MDSFTNDQYLLQHLRSQRYFLVTWYGENLAETDFLQYQLVRSESTLAELSEQLEALRERCDSQALRIVELEHALTTRGRSVAPTLATLAASSTTTLRPIPVPASAFAPLWATGSASASLSIGATGTVASGSPTLRPVTPAEGAGLSATSGTTMIFATAPAPVSTPTPALPRSGTVLGAAPPLPLPLPLPPAPVFPRVSTVLGVAPPPPLPSPPPSTQHVSPTVPAAEAFTTLGGGTLGSGTRTSAIEVEPMVEEEEDPEERVMELVKQIPPLTQPPPVEHFGGRGRRCSGDPEPSGKRRRGRPHRDSTPVLIGNPNAPTTAYRSRSRSP